ncbi:hypothetical protein [Morganella psychrotolerans]|uniref:Uncharacterized protein n=1 Tax=Morganella psychrotolerans TaxID=368603 RepID=A0A1B8HC67_9GAMM|nr:hypothetical protein [Morganella psychrotolerans]OBU06689.1 hypothetical protein AYY18_19860 [Morganella psychrotolerans]
MSGHPHAALMAKAAEIAKTDKEWYRHFQYKSGESDWRDMSASAGFHDCFEYRLKPRTIDINGHQVPEPAREPLEIGRCYVVADITIKGLCTYIWQGDDGDVFLLQCGLIHLSAEAAEAHIAALLSFTQK